MKIALKKDGQYIVGKVEYQTIEEAIVAAKEAAKYYHTTAKIVKE